MDLLQYKPKAQFAQRHLLTLQDYTPDEILQVLSLAAKLKLQRKLGMDQTHILRGKNVALIFTCLLSTSPHAGTLRPARACAKIERKNDSREERHDHGPAYVQL